MNRGIRIAVTAVMAVTMIGLGTGASLASPYSFTDSFQVKKAVFVFELEAEQACRLGVGTVTSIETAVGHIAASGIDVGDPNDPNDDLLIAPARQDMNLTSKVTFVPTDPSLPTYTGHSGFHFSWTTDETGLGVARIERAIVLEASDGSRYTLHQVGRAIFDLNQQASPNEGLVEITFDKIRCG
jgi:hypothetical protein